MFKTCLSLSFVSNNINVIHNHEADHRDGRVVKAVDYGPGQITPEGSNLGVGGVM